MGYCDPHQPPLSHIPMIQQIEAIQDRHYSPSMEFLVEVSFEGSYVQRVVPDVVVESAVQVVRAVYVLRLLVEDIPELVIIAFDAEYASRPQVQHILDDLADESYRTIRFKRREI